MGLAGADGGRSVSAAGNFAIPVLKATGSTIAGFSITGKTMFLVSCYQAAPVSDRLPDKRGGDAYRL